MKKFAIKEDGEINQRRVFKTIQEANDKLAKLKTDTFWNKFHSTGEVVECWPFEIWFRSRGEKDFVDFVSDKKNIEDAVIDAIEQLDFAFAINNSDFGVVAKYGEFTTEFISKLKDQ